jgi:hypothetical protein
MRQLDELVNTEEPGWDLVDEWMRDASNQVEVLPKQGERAGRVLVALQVTTRSPMGAIAFGCGGLVIDHGWLRILGSGGERLQGDLARWNGLGEEPIIQPIDGALIVAHDAVGGFFALDGGAFGPGKGSVFYFAPDLLEWEDTEKGYSDFVAWAMAGDLDQFYENARWPEWKEDIRAMSLDQGMSIHPPLWSKEYETEEVSRKPVPMPELLALQLDFAAQFAANTET